MSRALHLDTFASDKTRVSLISWRVTRSEKEEEEECDCEMTFPDKSWLMIVDSGGGKRVGRGEGKGGEGRESQFGQVAFKRRSWGSIQLNLKRLFNRVSSKCPTLL